VKTRRSSIAPGVALLFAVLAGPAPCADAPARTGAVPSTVLVPVSGIVSVKPESVSFSGQARVSSQLVLDTSRFHRPPSVILNIDLSKVSGTGSLTGVKYVARGGETLHMDLVRADTVEITFPFFRSADKEDSSAQSAVASFALSFDLDTGAVTKGEGTVAAPSFPEPETDLPQ